MLTLCVLISSEDGTLVSVFPVIEKQSLTISQLCSDTAPLCDAHPRNISATLFPGADFNNARISDFNQVDHWLMQQPNRLDSARMPWHDVHTMISGPAVMDVAQHFVER